MADNYIERMEQEAQARRQAKAAARQRQWLKRLKAYQASLKAKQEDNNSQQ